MENFPVEVIGNILSRLGGAHKVVMASGTCRKWREAYRKHLHALSFNSRDWPSYRDFTTSRLQILITHTIFQTIGLQELSIMMEDVDAFSASTVIAWLMYTRETLRTLCYSGKTDPDINILEFCGRQKLETLNLAHNSVTGVEQNFQTFPCLKSLSLRYISISVSDLNLLLSACPKIEKLKLFKPEFAMSDPQVTAKLSSPTLKSVDIGAVSLDKLILEADSIESLYVRDSDFEFFELIEEGTLKHLKLDNVDDIHCDILKTANNLETIDISNLEMIRPKFFQMISRFQKLKKLGLWNVVFDEIFEIESVAVWFPQLTHLCLCFDLKDGVLHNSGLQGSTLLVNVVVLELGWTTLNDSFSSWVEGLLKRCPNLKKLVIYGIASGAETYDESRILANFMSFMIQLMRIYIHVEVQFENAGYWPETKS